jgi:hypothetical protein
MHSCQHSYLERGRLVHTRPRNPHHIHQPVEVLCYFPKRAVSVLLPQRRLHLSIRHAVVHALLDAVHAMVEIADQVTFARPAGLEWPLPWLR